MVLNAGTNDRGRRGRLRADVGAVGLSVLGTPLITLQVSTKFINV